MALWRRGGNIFIQKPGSGFGRTPTDPFWLTPSTTDSNAKMDEYGKVPRGLFLNGLGIAAGSKDGRYGVDFWADNVGMDNQRYYFGMYEPGRQYFSLGWDQTPHLLSSSAKSIFGGVGSTRLTVDPATRTFFAGPPVLLTPTCGTARELLTSSMAAPRRGGAGFPAPMSNIELKTLREKFTAGYRNTMWDNWDFNVDYSNEHRTGTRPLGIALGLGTRRQSAAVMAQSRFRSRSTTGPRT